jgi:hypothetical protein
MLHLLQPSPESPIQTFAILGQEIIVDFKSGQALASSEFWQDKRDRYSPLPSIDANTRRFMLRQQVTPEIFNQAINDFQQASGGWLPEAIANQDKLQFSHYYKTKKISKNITHYYKEQLQAIITELKTRENVTVRAFLHGGNKMLSLETLLRNDLNSTNHAKFISIPSFMNTLEEWRKDKDLIASIDAELQKNTEYYVPSFAKLIDEMYEDFSTMRKLYRGYSYIPTFIASMLSASAVLLKILPGTTPVSPYVLPSALLVSAEGWIAQAKAAKEFDGYQLLKANPEITEEQLDSIEIGQACEKSWCPQYKSYSAIPLKHPEHYYAGRAIEKLKTPDSERVLNVARQSLRP